MLKNQRCDKMRYTYNDPKREYYGITLNTGEIVCFFLAKNIKEESYGLVIFGIYHRLFTCSMLQAFEMEFRNFYGL